MNITDLVVRPISEVEALEVIFDTHYSKIMPRLTKHYLGGFIGDKLVGVMTLGWGTRPVHTIKLLFPSLGTQDYFEIGKMCMLEEMPKNSESVFLSRVIQWIKENTTIKVLFTWADGILGKPGYVYQSANFMYGGFIWTDLYISDTGEKVHPRTSQGLSKSEDAKYGHRPTLAELKAKGWNHYRGKQFRYVYFICDKKEKKKLLTESPMNWKTPYPKDDALEWKIQDMDTGEWSDTDSIVYDKTALNTHSTTTTRNRKTIAAVKQMRQFFDF